jgi:hypothetical protein
MARTLTSPPASVKRKGEPETADTIARDLVALAMWADLVDHYRGWGDGTAKLWQHVKAAVEAAGEHASVALHLIRCIRNLQHFGADGVVGKFVDHADALRNAA